MDVKVETEKLTNWETYTLGEVANYLNGRAFKPEEWENEGLPIIRIQNLNDPEASFNYSTEDHKDRYLVQHGDLLFAWSASLDAYIWKGEDAWLNQHIFKVVPKDFINKRFLYYYLKRIIRDLYAKSHGSGMVHVTKKKFERTEILIPPLPTQHRIVEKIEELFSDLDNGIENLKKAKQQLGTYKQSVLKAAFEGKLTKEWREQQNDLPIPDELREQIKEERKKYRQQQLKEWEQEVEKWKEQGEPGRKPRKPRKPKDLDPLEDDELEELPNIPDDWFYHQLYYLGELGRGRSRHRPRSDEKLFKDGQYPFIQTGQVRNANKYVTEYNKCYNDFGLEQSKLWPSGTLCITIAANIAETAFLKFDACFPDSVVGFIGHNNIINKEFIYYYFHAIQKRLEAYAPATAQKNINLTILENLAIPYCSPKEQFQIVNELESRLSVVDQNLNTIEQELQKSKALRQSILKRAFEGKLIN